MISEEVSEKQQSEVDIAAVNVECYIHTHTLYIYIYIYLVHCLGDVTLFSHLFQFICLGCQLFFEVVRLEIHIVAARVLSGIHIASKASRYERKTPKTHGWKGVREGGKWRREGYILWKTRRGARD